LKFARLHVGVMIHDDADAEYLTVESDGIPEGPGLAGPHLPGGAREGGLRGGRGRGLRVRGVGEEGHASSDQEQKLRMFRLLDGFLQRRIGTSAEQAVDG